MSEQIALDLMIREAEGLFDDPDVIEDHIGLLSSENDPDAPGELEFLFEPFYADEQRDPNRGFRR